MLHNSFHNQRTIVIGLLAFLLGLYSTDSLSQATDPALAAQARELKQRARDFWRKAAAARQARRTAERRYREQENEIRNIERHNQQVREEHERCLQSTRRPCIARNSHPAPLGW